MQWLIWVLVLPACLAWTVLIVGHCHRKISYLFLAGRARVRFHRQREWLEAGFLEALAREDPLIWTRWEEAHWLDEVTWARDRQTGRLLALVGVEFDADPLLDGDDAERHATVVFEYHRGRWRSDGNRLDAIQPFEAFLLRHGRYEPLAIPEHRG